MILIVSSAEDSHAHCVRNELHSLGRKTQILNTRQCGAGLLMHQRIGEPGISGFVDHQGDAIDTHEIETVWYRRPWPIAIPAVSDPEDNQFARREWNESLDGLLLSLDARFINPISNQRAASKSRQLELARRIGLHVPDTLITNDPMRVESFVDLHAGEVVHKSLTSHARRFLETRRWSEVDRAALADLPIAPTIFQEQIVGDDVRVTVVGHMCFAARIVTSRTRRGVDSRLDTDAVYEPLELPTRIQRALLDLMHQLGLVFGTVDLKLTTVADDDFVFLEINPQGQFLYVEIRTGLPITAALARLLARG